MSLISTVFFAGTLILNLFLAGVLIFLERRDAQSTWAWLLVLFFIPVFGFLIYLLFGRRLRKKKMFRWEGRKKIGIEQLISYQIEAIEERRFEFRLDDAELYKELIFLQLNNNGAVLTQDNDVQVFSDGISKFEALLADIERAKHHIHIQYYIYRMDGIGSRIRDLLIKKAHQGVLVRVLYDDMGSRSLRKRHFQKLREAGGEVVSFFPSYFPLINPRLNYRNHRKIVVIDGSIAYLGGFNVGDEYLGMDKRLGNWRDTHLRIEGSAVHPCQTRFILDWNQAAGDRAITYHETYFPAIPLKGSVGMQIVSSGPDSDWEEIKNGYIKMVMMAKRCVYVQTPYFIPDASLMDCLRIACLSGIDVRLMIPDKPDHLFVHWASLSYAGQLLDAGAKVYLYKKGFLHAKVIVIDDEASTVGTANIDMRSFKLNFEVNAFLYDQEKSRELGALFREDIKDSQELTPEAYLNRTRIVKIKESLALLLSPIL